MTSCTIIISHFESFEFLRMCVNQIRKFKRDDIEQTILISEQSGANSDDRKKVVYEYADSPDVCVFPNKPLYSGYGLDYILHNVPIDSQYICQLHPDSMVIHRNWLYVPIKLIQNHGVTFVGQHQFVCDGTQSIYPPNKFFAMSQCFNVARTETYTDMSIEAGFTRFHNRPESGLKFKNNEWNNWANHNYAARGSDDDVVAFHWEDQNREHDKLGLAITGMINTAEQGGSFGRTIDDLVFHFSSGNESRGVMEMMPQKYQYYYHRIQNGFNDELLNEMLSEIKPNNSKRVLWSGSSKVALGTSEYLNNIIEDLKKD